MSWFYTPQQVVEEKVFGFICRVLGYRNLLLLLENRRENKIRLSHINPERKPKEGEST